MTGANQWSQSTQGDRPLDVALRAARAAADIIVEVYGRAFDVTAKADRSPVTEADVAAEQAIRETILGAFPDDSIHGEEAGHQAGRSSRTWLVDPLDGTKSFVRRYPFFSTQIALMDREELILGVSNAPLFKECAWAVRGNGAELNGERLQVSATTNLSEASLSTGNLKRLAEGAEGWSWQGLGRIVTEVHRIRGYGDFYHYHLLAGGKIDAVLESDLNILDIAALTVILREAGAVVTDLHGHPIGLSTTSLLATATPELHAEILTRVNAPAKA